MKQEVLKKHPTANRVNTLFSVYEMMHMHLSKELQTRGKEFKLTMSGYLYTVFCEC